ncbi:MAG: cytochrome P450 [bacterium]|nr:cytochrome P450 [bacterium]
MSSAAPATLQRGPKGLPVLGSILELRRKGILNFYYDLWRQYGDVTESHLGPMHAFGFVRAEHLQHILVHHADQYVKGLSHAKLRVAIGNGILTLEGERWYRQHKLMQPTYTRRNVNGFADIMTDEAQKLLARWGSNPALQQGVNINQEMTSVTMNIISRAVFGFALGNEFQRAAQALHSLLDYTAKTTNSIIDTPLFIPTATNQQLKQGRRVLREFITRIIAQRRSEGLQDDLLSMLMSAKDADTGEVMTDEELFDEVVITFFAGHETTASLLTWTLFLLSKHPDVEAQLHAELDAVLNGRSPTLDDMQNLPYTRRVLDETLRLYGPVPVVARDATEAGEVDGVVVPKGALLVMLPYATHRHPDYWEKPDAFYPDHFTEAQTANRPRYAYLPFGAGQRICLGMHFALLEATLLLAEIMQRYRVRLAQDFDGGVEFIGVIRPRSPIILRFEPRNSA